MQLLIQPSTMATTDFKKAMGVATMELLDLCASGTKKTTIQMLIQNLGEKYDDSKTAEDHLQAKKDPAYWESLDNSVFQKAIGFVVIVRKWFCKIESSVNSTCTAVMTFATCFVQVAHCLGACSF